MKHRNLLGVLLPLPFLLAPSCMQELLRPRIEFPPAWLFELSPDGSVAVGSSQTHVWKNGAIVELPHPLDLWPLDVSYDGRVIVGYRCCQAGDAHPYRWDQGVVTDLWPANGGASDVSWDGEVVVGTVYDASLPALGVMWVGDALIPLTTEDGFRADTAQAVSADGETIAGWGTDASGHTSRYLWHAAEVTWIEGLPGADDQPSSLEYSDLVISHDGTTVVDTDYSGPDGSGWCCGGWSHAFRWRDGVTEPLPLLDGAQNPRTKAYAISENGEIVVGDASGPDDYQVAMIWDSTHGARTLESLLVELGAELPDGMHLDTVFDMSSDGRRILGLTDLHPVYRQNMFIVTLPPACADHLDNDGDGLTDLREDRGCRSKFDSSEEP